MKISKVTDYAALMDVHNFITKPKRFNIGRAKKKLAKSSLHVVNAKPLPVSKMENDCMYYMARC